MKYFGFFAKYKSRTVLGVISGTGFRNRFSERRFWIRGSKAGSEGCQPEVSKVLGSGHQSWKKICVCWKYVFKLWNILISEFWKI